MEPLKGDSKLPNMVMCGDHPSLTKTELNLKEMKLVVAKDKDRKIPISYARISPTSSRTEKPVDLERTSSRPTSEHALRMLQQRGRSATASRQDPTLALANRDLVQAAVGRLRWAPYVVVWWVVVVAAAHALHALAGALAAALPALRKLCQYCRLLTEESWRREESAAQWQHLRRALLAGATALLYALLGALAVMHAVLRWVVEPLGEDIDDGPSCGQVTKVIDYVDDFDMKIKTDKS